MSIPHAPTFYTPRPPSLFTPLISNPPTLTFYTTHLNPSYPLTLSLSLSLSATAHRSWSHVQAVLSCGGRAAVCCELHECLPPRDGETTGAGRSRHGGAGTVSATPICRGGEGGGGRGGGGGWVGKVRGRVGGCGTDAFDVPSSLSPQQCCCVCAEPVGLARPVQRLSRAILQCQPTLQACHRCREWSVYVHASCMGIGHSMSSACVYSPLVCGLLSFHN